MRLDVAADGSPHANSSATDGHAGGDDADRKRRGILGFSRNSPLNQSFGRRSAREMRRSNRWTRREGPCIRKSSCIQPLLWRKAANPIDVPGLEGRRRQGAVRTEAGESPLVLGIEECRLYLNLSRSGAAKSGSSVSSRSLAFSASISQPKPSNPLTSSTWRWV